MAHEILWERTGWASAFRATSSRPHLRVARRVHEFVVGQIDEATLADIWRLPVFRAFRQRVRVFDFPPCFHCGGCPLTETNDEDCYNNPAPVCGECAWAQGIVLCP